MQPNLKRNSGSGRLARLLLSLLTYLPLCTGAWSQSPSKEQVNVHYKRAEAALAIGQAATAAAEFREILKLDPTNAESYANLGVIAFKQGDFTQAKQLFGDSLKRNPSLWDAKAFLGMSQLRLGETREGEPLLEGSYFHIHNPGLRVDAGVSIIKFHQESKTLDQIVEVIRDLENSNPTNPEAHYVAYRAYSDLASHAVQALSKTAPDSGRMHQILGEAAMTQDNFPEAIAQFRKALESDSRMPGIHYELGHALLTNSQDESTRMDAQHEFEAALTSDTADYNAEYGLGEVFRLGLDLKRAEQHYSRALELRSDFAEAQVGLGTVLVDQGKLNEGILQFRDAVQSDPENEAAHYRLARAYRAIGRTQDETKEMEVFQKLRQMHGSLPSKSSPAAAANGETSE